MSHILLKNRSIINIASSIIKKVIQIIAFSSFPPQLTIFLQKLRGVRIGENSVIGRFVYIDDYKPELVKIGKNVVISTGCIILTHKRKITDYKVTKAYYEYPYIFGQVIISDNVQIGVGAILMPGITIGEGSIVGAGAVVTKDIPSGCLAIGSPAKVVKNYLEV